MAKYVILRVVDVCWCEISRSMSLSRVGLFREPEDSGVVVACCDLALWPT